MLVSGARPAADQFWYGPWNTTMGTGPSHKSGRERAFDDGMWQKLKISGETGTLLATVTQRAVTHPMHVLSTPGQCSGARRAFEASFAQAPRPAPLGKGFCWLMINLRNSECCCCVWHQCPKRVPRLDGTFFSTYEES